MLHLKELLKKKLKIVNLKRSINKRWWHSFNSIFLPLSSSSIGIGHLKICYCCFAEFWSWPCGSLSWFGRPEHLIKTIIGCFFCFLECPLVNRINNWNPLQFLPCYSFFQLNALCFYSIRFSPLCDFPLQLSAILLGSFWNLIIIRSVVRIFGY